MRDLYYVLFTTLMANCPYDRNNIGSHMKENITLTDYGDYWMIRITGPGAYNYAKKVNEKQTPTVTGPNKGKINYHWVERTIEQVGRLFGVEVEYELS